MTINNFLSCSNLVATSQLTAALIDWGWNLRELTYRLFCPSCKIHEGDFVRNVILDEGASVLHSRFIYG